MKVTRSIGIENFGKTCVIVIEKIFSRNKILFGIDSGFKSIANTQNFFLCVSMNQFPQTWSCKKLGWVQMISAKKYGGLKKKLDSFEFQDALSWIQLFTWKKGNVFSFIKLTLFSPLIFPIPFNFNMKSIHCLFYFYWRTSQPRTFQPQGSTPDLSTPDFSIMNSSTMNFPTLDFSTQKPKGTFQPQTFK